MQHENRAVPDNVGFICIPSAGEECPTSEDFRQMSIVPTPLRMRPPEADKPSPTGGTDLETQTSDAEVRNLVREMVIELHPHYQLESVDITLLLMNVGGVLVSSGAAVGAYQILKTWVDARNGRKLKIKVGDIEVEATQMKEEDVLRIFELLQEKADRKKIRELLISASKGEGRPDGH